MDRISPHLTICSGQVHPLTIRRQRNTVRSTTEICATQHERRLAFRNPVDAILQLLVGIPAAVAQAEIVVRNIDRIVRRDRDVVRAAEPAAVHSARQQRMRAVLLQAHHLSIVVGAPDHAALMIHARTGRTDQKHMTATGTSLRADMLRIVAGITSPLHEDGDLLLWRDLVEDIVK